MYREEQVAPRGARPRHPILERDELVVLARQHDPVAPRRLQEARGQLGGRERDVFLIAAGDADGAGIDAAMAGIQHDRAARRRLRLRGSRTCKGSGLPNHDRRSRRNPPDPPKYGSPTNPAVSGAHDIVAPTSRLLDSSILPWSAHSLHE